MWKQKLCAWVQWSTIDNIEFHCHIAQHSTCLEAARIAYGIPKITLNRCLALLRLNGPGAFSTEKGLSDWDKDARRAEVVLTLIPPPASLVQTYCVPHPSAGS